MKFACVFPGQGSQSVGMMSDFLDEDNDVQDVFKRASDALGYDMAKLVDEGPADNLNQTERTQPAMLTAGVAAWVMLQKYTDARPAMMAGHSLGEYTALVCAGAMDFEDAVKLVAERGRLMQTAVPDGVGAMAAVLGLEDDQVRSLCKNACGDGLIVQPVNFNSPGQIVIAGHAAAVDKAMELAKDVGAKRALKLPVSVPSHSALMTEAAEHLSERLAAIRIHVPQVPVYQNVDANLHSDPADIAECLKKQLYNPVLWVDTVRNMAAAGIDATVECGPGKVLAGLNKRIEKSLQNFTIDTQDNFNKFISALED